MKLSIAALLAGVVLGSTAGAGAISQRVSGQIRADGVLCENTKMPAALLCIRSDGKGYSVGFHRKFVIVVGPKGRIIYTRNQPQ